MDEVRPTTSPEEKPVTQETGGGALSGSFARRAFVAGGVAVAAALLLALFWYGGRFLLLVFSAALFAILLRGLALVARRVTRLPYGFALAVTVVVVAGGLLAFGWFFGTSIAGQATQLVETVRQAVTDLESQIQKSPFGSLVFSRLRSMGSEASHGGRLLSTVTGFFSSTFDDIVYIAVTLIAGLYFAASPALYRSGILWLLPQRKRHRGGEILDAVGNTLWWWLIGRFFVMAVNGVLTGVAMWLLGVPLPIMLGLLTGLLYFVPNIGAIVAGTPAVLLGLMAGGPMKALYVAIAFTVLQNLEGFLLTPLVQQRTVSLPPGVIILSQVLMGMLFGFIGLLLATPIAATALVLTRMVYIEDVLGDPMKGKGRSTPAG